jgi:L-seryl-tRNA(Ser) seleniumtransferase
VRLDPGPVGADALALRLRLGDPPVVCRVSEGHLLLDVRTLRPAECLALAQALSRALDAD